MTTMRARAFGLDHAAGLVLVHHGLFVAVHVAAPTLCGLSGHGLEAVVAEAENGADAQAQPAERAHPAKDGSQFQFLRSKRR